MSPKGSLPTSRVSTGDVKAVCESSGSPFSYALSVPCAASPAALSAVPLEGLAGAAGELCSYDDSSSDDEGSQMTTEALSEEVRVSEATFSETVRGTDNTIIGWADPRSVASPLSSVITAASAVAVKSSAATDPPPQGAALVSQTRGSSAFSAPVGAPPPSVSSRAIWSSLLETCGVVAPEMVSTEAMTASSTPSDVDESQIRGSLDEEDE